MEKILYLSSTDSTDYYPANRGSRFSVKLNTEVDLPERKFESALGEISITISEEAQFNFLYLCADFVTESIVSNFEEKIVRKIYCSSERGFKIVNFDHLLFCQLSRNRLDTLSFKVLSDSFTEANFINQVDLTIIIRRKRYGNG